MALQSDITLNASKFQPSAVSEKAAKLNEKLIAIMDGKPMWWEVGAPKYRQMRWNGETPLPKPVIIESGKNMKIPSREKGREIPSRVFAPEGGKTPRGVFMHIHGGGWVLMDEATQDALLKFMVDAADLTVISVGYRLAPEYPFPAGPEDCYDVAEWLVDNARSEFGAELAFTGGESAGGHLAILTCLHLLKSRPEFRFKGGLALHFGAYDLAGFAPQAHHFDRPLVLTGEIMHHFMDAFLPGTTEAQRRHPSISPLYADLRSLSSLPPALFTCGTEDVLLDDTVFMGCKWQMAGAETVVKIFPGAPHGYIGYPDGVSDEAREGRAVLKEWLRVRVGLGQGGQTGKL